MKKVRVLSLDGGGMRGVIPATIMVFIEDEIKKRTKNAHARIADYFDLIVGTSTGGILGCFYLTPNKTIAKNETGAGDPMAGISGKNQTDPLPSSKYAAQAALDFYMEKGYEIFNASRYNPLLGLRQIFTADQYSPKKIEKIFLDEFGELKMHELLKPAVVTTYNLNNKKSFFFSSREKPEKFREFYVRDAVRSTSAAPTYFPPARIQNLKTGMEMVNIDGGVFANNPTMCAFAECKDSRFSMDREYPDAKDMLILSIGTGGGQFNLPSVERSSKWDIIKWAKSIPDIMMNGSIDTVDYQMYKLFQSLGEENKSNYIRIDVPTDDNNEVRNLYSSDMADASPKNLQALHTAGLETWGHEIRKSDRLKKFIDKLIEIGPDISPNPFYPANNQA